MISSSSPLRTVLSAQVSHSAASVYVAVELLPSYPLFVRVAILPLSYMLIPRCRRYYADWFAPSTSSSEALPRVAPHPCFGYLPRSRGVFFFCVRSQMSAENSKCIATRESSEMTRNQQASGGISPPSPHPARSALTRAAPWTPDPHNPRTVPLAARSPPSGARDLDADTAGRALLSSEIGVARPRSAPTASRRARRRPQGGCSSHSSRTS